MSYLPTPPSDALMERLSKIRIPHTMRDPQEELNKALALTNLPSFAEGREQVENANKNKKPRSKQQRKVQKSMAEELAEMQAADAAAEVQKQAEWNQRYDASIRDEQGNLKPSTPGVRWQARQDEWNAAQAVIRASVEAGKKKHDQKLLGLQGATTEPKPMYMIPVIAEGVKDDAEKLRDQLAAKGQTIPVLTPKERQRRIRSRADATANTLVLTDEQRHAMRQVQLSSFALSIGPTDRRYPLVTGKLAESYKESQARFAAEREKDTGFVSPEGRATTKQYRSRLGTSDSIGRGHTPLPVWNTANYTTRVNPPSDHYAKVDPQIGTPRGSREKVIPTEFAPGRTLTDHEYARWNHPEGQTHAVRTDAEERARPTKAMEYSQYNVAPQFGVTMREAGVSPEHANYEETPFIQFYRDMQAKSAEARRPSLWSNQSNPSNPTMVLQYGRKRVSIEKDLSPRAQSYVIQEESRKAWEQSIWDKNNEQRAARKAVIDADKAAREASGLRNIPRHRSLPVNPAMSTEQQQNTQGMYQRLQTMAEASAREPVVAALGEDALNDAYQAGGFPQEVLDELNRLVVHQKLYKGSQEALSDEEVAGRIQDMVADMGPVTVPTADSVGKTRSQALTAEEQGKAAVDAFRMSMSEPPTQAEQTTEALHQNIVLNTGMPASTVNALFKDVSVEQLAAIQSHANRLMISAGAGGGKSLTAFARVAYLFAKNQVQNDGLYLSGTRSGAAAMVPQIQRLHDAFKGANRDFVNPSSDDFKAPSTTYAVARGILFNEDQKINGKTAWETLGLDKQRYSRALVSSGTGKDALSARDVQRSQFLSQEELVKKMMQAHGQAAPSRAKLNQIVSRINEIKQDPEEFKAAMKRGAELHAKYRRADVSLPKHERTHASDFVQYGSKETLPDELQLYRYQKTLHAKEGFVLHDTQFATPHHDMLDMLYQAETAAKAGFGPRPSHIILDEMQDSHRQEFRMVAALAGPETHIITAGDLSQMAIPTNRRPDQYAREELSAGGHEVAEQTLLLNQRTRSPILQSIANALLQSRGLNAPDSYAHGAPQITASTKGKRSDDPTIHSAGTYEEMFRQAIGHSIKDTGIDLGKMKENLDANVSLFKGVTFTMEPRQSPTIMQTRSERALYRKVFKQFLGEHLGEEHADYAFENLYTEELPANAPAHKFAGLLVNEAKSNSLESPKIIMQRTGKWNKGGYLLNLYTMLTRARGRARLYSSNKGLPGQTHITELKDFHGVALPPELHEVMEIAAHDLVHRQNVPVEKLPNYLRVALANPHVASPSMLNEQPALLHHLIEATTMAGTNYQPAMATSPVVQQGGVEGAHQERDDDEKLQDGMAKKQKATASSLAGDYSKDQTRLIEQGMRLLEVQNQEYGTPQLGGSVPRTAMLPGTELQEPWMGADLLPRPDTFPTTMEPLVQRKLTYDEKNHRYTNDQVELVPDKTAQFMDIPAPGEATTFLHDTIKPIYDMSVKERQLVEARKADNQQDFVGDESNTEANFPERDWLKPAASNDDRLAVKQMQATKNLLLKAGYSAEVKALYANGQRMHDGSGSDGTDDMPATYGIVNPTFAADLANLAEAKGYSNQADLIRTLADTAPFRNNQQGMKITPAYMQQLERTNPRAATELRNVLTTPTGEVVTDLEHPEIQRNLKAIVHPMGKVDLNASSMVMAARYGIALPQTELAPLATELQALKQSLLTSGYVDPMAGAHQAAQTALPEITPAMAASLRELSISNPDVFTAYKDQILEGVHETSPASYTPEGIGSTGDVLTRAQRDLATIPVVPDEFAQQRAAGIPETEDRENFTAFSSLNDLHQKFATAEALARTKASIEYLSGLSEKHRDYNPDRLQGLQDLQARQEKELELVTKRNQTARISPAGVRQLQRAIDQKKADINRGLGGESQQAIYHEELATLEGQMKEAQGNLPRRTQTFGAMAPEQQEHLSAIHAILNDDQKMGTEFPRMLNYFMQATSGHNMVESTIKPSTNGLDAEHKIVVEHARQLLAGVTSEYRGGNRDVAGVHQMLSTLDEVSSHYAEHGTMDRSHIQSLINVLGMSRREEDHPMLAMLTRKFNARNGEDYTIHPGMIMNTDATSVPFRSAIAPQVKLGQAFMYVGGGRGKNQTIKEGEEGLLGTLLPFSYTNKDKKVISAPFGRPITNGQREAANILPQEDWNTLLNPHANARYGIHPETGRRTEKSLFRQVYEQAGGKNANVEMDLNSDAGRAAAKWRTDWRNQYSEPAYTLHTADGRREPVSLSQIAALTSPQAQALAKKQGKEQEVKDFQEKVVAVRDAKRRKNAARQLPNPFPAFESPPLPLYDPKSLGEEKRWQLKQLRLKSNEMQGYEPMQRLITGELDKVMMPLWNEGNTGKGAYEVGDEVHVISNGQATGMVMRVVGNQLINQSHMKQKGKRLLSDLGDEQIKELGYVGSTTEEVRRELEAKRVKGKGYQVLSLEPVYNPKHLYDATLPPDQRRAADWKELAAYNPDFLLSEEERYAKRKAEKVDIHVGDSSKNPSVYTLGYQNEGAWGHMMDAVKEGAVIVDVRKDVTGNIKKGWDQASLKKSLGEQYVHIPELGNVNHGQGKPIQIDRAKEGIAKLKQHFAGKKVVLMCACGNPETCHRTTVANMLKGEIPGLEVHHLGTRKEKAGNASEALPAKPETGETRWKGKKRPNFLDPKEYPFATREGLAREEERQDAFDRGDWKRASQFDDIGRQGTFSYHVDNNVLNSDAQTLVNTVNLRGKNGKRATMGAGLAKAMKETFGQPLLDAYHESIDNGQLTLGQPALVLGNKNRPNILNFPTKDYWEDPSQLKWIEQGMAHLATHAKEMGIRSIAFPKMGTNNGKLDWNDVGPIMAKHVPALLAQGIDVQFHVGEHDKQFMPPAKEDRVLHAYSTAENVEHRRFSAFNMQLGEGSIEDWYQSSKRDKFGNPLGKDRKQAKGKQADHFEFMGQTIPGDQRHQFYLSLWHQAFKEQPELFKYAQGFDGFHDKYAEREKGRIRRPNEAYLSDPRVSANQAAAIAHLVGQNNQVQFPEHVQRALAAYRKQVDQEKDEQEKLVNYLQQQGGESSNDAGPSTPVAMSQEKPPAFSEETRNALFAATPTSQFQKETQALAQIVPGLEDAGRNHFLDQQRQQMSGLPATPALDIPALFQEREYNKQARRAAKEGHEVYAWDDPYHSADTPPWDTTPISRFSSEDVKMPTQTSYAISQEQQDEGEDRYSREFSQKRDQWLEAQRKQVGELPPASYHPWQDREARRKSIQEKWANRYNKDGQLDRALTTPYQEETTTGKKTRKTRAGLQPYDKDDYHIIPQSDPRYPAAILSQMGEEAPILHARGDLSLLGDTHRVAVPASYKPSDEEKAAAYAQGQALASAGHVTVANMGKAGILAHKGAIEAGGRSIAVLPKGLHPNEIFPKEDRAWIEEQVAQKKMLLTGPVPMGHRLDSALPYEPTWTAEGMIKALGTMPTAPSTVELPPPPAPTKSPVFTEETRAALYAAPSSHLSPFMREAQALGKIQPFTQINTPEVSSSRFSSEDVKMPTQTSYAISQEQQNGGEDRYSREFSQKRDQWLEAQRKQVGALPASPTLDIPALFQEQEARRKRIQGKWDNRRYNPGGQLDRDIATPVPVKKRQLRNPKKTTTSTALPEAPASPRRGLDLGNGKYAPYYDQPSTPLPGFMKEWSDPWYQQKTHERLYEQSSLLHRGYSLTQQGEEYIDETGMPPQMFHRLYESNEEFQQRARQHITNYEQTSIDDHFQLLRHTVNHKRDDDSGQQEQNYIGLAHTELERFQHYRLAHHQLGLPLPQWPQDLQPIIDATTHPALQEEFALTKRPRVIDEPFPVGAANLLLTSPEAPSGEAAVTPSLFARNTHAQALTRKMMEGTIESASKWNVDNYASKMLYHHTGATFLALNPYEDRTKANWDQWKKDSHAVYEGVVAEHKQQGLYPSPQINRFLDAHKMMLDATYDPHQEGWIIEDAKDLSKKENLTHYQPKKQLYYFDSPLNVPPPPAKKLYGPQARTLLGEHFFTNDFLPNIPQKRESYQPDAGLFYQTAGVFLAMNPHEDRTKENWHQWVQDVQKDYEQRVAADTTQRSPAQNVLLAKSLTVGQNFLAGQSMNGIDPETFDPHRNQQAAEIARDFRNRGSGYNFFQNETRFSPSGQQKPTGDAATKPVTPTATPSSTSTPAKPVAPTPSQEAKKGGANPTTPVVTVGNARVQTQTKRAHEEEVEEEPEWLKAQQGDVEYDDNAQKALLQSNQAAPVLTEEEKVHPNEAQQALQETHGPKDHIKAQLEEMQHAIREGKTLFPGTPEEYHIPPASAEQLGVIDDPEKHMVIKAGPGSGKTTTLIKHMLGQVSKGMLPQNMLSVSTLRSGRDEIAKQMKTWAEPLLPDEEAYKFRAPMTIHALSHHIVMGSQAEMDEHGREYYTHPVLEALGMGDYNTDILQNVSAKQIAHWKKAGDTDKVEAAMANSKDRFLQEAIATAFAHASKDVQKNLPRADQLSKLSTQREHIENVKKYRVIADEDTRHPEFHSIYGRAMAQGRKDIAAGSYTPDAAVAAYEDHRMQQKRLDFDDQPYLATKVFHQGLGHLIPEDLKSVQGIYTDEAQDLTPAGLYVTTSLAHWIKQQRGSDKTPHMAFAHDPSQSAMTGRGGIPINELHQTIVKSVSQLGSRVSERLLTENYRSPKAVVALVNSIVRRLQGLHQETSPIQTAMKDDWGQLDLPKMRKNHAMVYEDVTRDMMRDAGIDLGQVRKNAEEGHDYLHGITPNLPLGEMAFVAHRNDQHSFFEHVFRETMSKALGSKTHGARFTEQILRRDYPEQGEEDADLARNQITMATPANIRSHGKMNVYSDITGGGKWSEADFYRQWLISLSRPTKQLRMYASTNPMKRDLMEQYKLPGGPEHFHDTQPDNPKEGSFRYFDNPNDKPNGPSKGIWNVVPNHQPRWPVEVAPGKYNLKGMDTLMADASTELKGMGAPESVYSGVSGLPSIPMIQGDSQTGTPVNATSLVPNRPTTGNQGSSRGGIRTQNNQQQPQQAGVGSLPQRQGGGSAPSHHDVDDEQAEQIRQIPRPTQQAGPYQTVPQVRDYDVKATLNGTQRRVVDGVPQYDWVRPSDVPRSLFGVGRLLTDEELQAHADLAERGRAPFMERLSHSLVSSPLVNHLFSSLYGEDLQAFSDRTQKPVKPPRSGLGERLSSLHQEWLDSPYTGNRPIRDRVARGGKSVLGQFPQGLHALTNWFTQGNQYGIDLPDQPVVSPPVPHEEVKAPLPTAKPGSIKAMLLARREERRLLAEQSQPPPKIPLLSQAQQQALFGLSSTTVSPFMQQAQALAKIQSISLPSPTKSGMPVIPATPKFPTIPKTPRLVESELHFHLDKKLQRDQAEILLGNKKAALDNYYALSEYTAGAFLALTPHVERTRENWQTFAQEAHGHYQDILKSPTISPEDQRFLSPFVTNHENLINGTRPDYDPHQDEDAIRQSHLFAWPGTRTHYREDQKTFAPSAVAMPSIPATPKLVEPEPSPSVLPIKKGSLKTEFPMEVFNQINTPPLSHVMVNAPLKKFTAIHQEMAGHWEALPEIYRDYVQQVQEKGDLSYPHKRGEALSPSEYLAIVAKKLTKNRKENKQLLPEERVLPALLSKLYSYAAQKPEVHKELRKAVADLHGDQYPRGKMQHFMETRNPNMTADEQQQMHATLAAKWEGLPQAFQEQLHSRDLTAAKPISEPGNYLVKQETWKKKTSGAGGPSQEPFEEQMMHYFFETAQRNAPLHHAMKNYASSKNLESRLAFAAEPHVKAILSDADKYTMSARGDVRFKEGADRALSDFSHLRTQAPQLFQEVMASGKEQHDPAFFDAYRSYRNLGIMEHHLGLKQTAVPTELHPHAKALMKANPNQFKGEDQYLAGGPPIAQEHQNPFLADSLSKGFRDQLSKIMAGGTFTAQNVTVNAGANQPVNITSNNTKVNAPPPAHDSSGGGNASGGGNGPLPPPAAMQPPPSSGGGAPPAEPPCEDGTCAPGEGSSKKSGKGGKGRSSIWNNEETAFGHTMTRIGGELQFLGQLGVQIADAALKQGSDYRQATMTLGPSTGATGDSGFFNFEGGKGTIDNYEHKILPALSLTQVAQLIQSYTGSTNTQFSQSGTLGNTTDIGALATITGMDPASIQAPMLGMAGTLGQGKSSTAMSPIASMLYQMYGGNLSATNVTPTLQTAQELLPQLQGLNPSGGSQLPQVMALLQTGLNAGMTTENFGQISSVVNTLASAGSNPDTQQQYQLANLFGQKNLTADTGLVGYQSDVLNRQENLAQTMLQQNINGKGLTLPNLQIQISQAQITMDKAQLDMSGLQQQYNVASFQEQQKIQTAEIGPIGADISRTSYFDWMRNQQQAGYNPLSPETGTQFKNTPTFGLQNEQFYAGIEHQRSMMVLGRSPLLADAAFQENMKYLNLQEAFYKEQLKLTNDQRSFTVVWQTKLLDAQGGILALQEKQFGLSQEMASYQQQQDKIANDYLSQQVDALKNIIVADEQSMRGDGPLNGHNIQPADIVSMLAQQQKSDPKTYTDDAMRKKISKLVNDDPAQTNTLFQLMKQLEKPGANIKDIEKQLAGTTDKALLAQLQKEINGGAFQSQQQTASQANQSLQYGGTKDDWKNLIAASNKLNDQMEGVAKALAKTAPLTLYLGNISQHIGDLATGIGTIANIIGFGASIVSALGGARFIGWIRTFMPAAAGDAAAPEVVAGAAPELAAGGAAALSTSALAAIALPVIVSLIGAGIIALMIKNAMDYTSGRKTLTTGDKNGAGSVGGYIDQSGYGNITSVGSAHYMNDGNGHYQKLSQDKDPNLWQRMNDIAVDKNGKTVSTWQAMTNPDGLTYYHQDGSQLTPQQLKQLQQNQPKPSSTSSNKPSGGPHVNPSLVYHPLSKTPASHLKIQQQHPTVDSSSFFTSQGKWMQDHLWGPVGKYIQDNWKIVTGDFRRYGGIINDNWKIVTDDFKRYAGDWNTYWTSTVPKFWSDRAGEWNNYWTVFVPKFWSDRAGEWNAGWGKIWKGISDGWSTGIGKILHFFGINPDNKPSSSGNKNSTSSSNNNLLTTILNLLNGGNPGGTNGGSGSGNFGSTGGSGSVPATEPMGHPGFLTPPVNAEFHKQMNYGIHQGVDFAASEGTSLRSFNAGQVTAAGWYPWGGEVDVNMGNGLTERYLHLSSLGVHRGQQVGKGDYIGLTGGGTVHSGLGFWSSGSHSHVQVDAGNINKGINPWDIWALSNTTNISQYYGATKGAQPNPVKSHPRNYSADGGVVLSPTTTTVGEGGQPEAIVPLSQLSSLAASIMGWLPSSAQGASLTGVSSTRGKSTSITIGTINLTVGDGHGKMSASEKDSLFNDLIGVLDAAATHVSSHQE